MTAPHLHGNSGLNAIPQRSAGSGIRSARSRAMELPRSHDGITAMWQLQSNS